MSLSAFILQNMEDILVEWEKFARTIPAAAGMDRAALRSETERILRAIARGMRRLQTDAQQEARSKGEAQPRGRGDSAAESHASARLAEGFDLNQMVSEYRALRASVIRLWTARMSNPGGGDLYELTRFNEAIDQALTESTARFKEKLDRSQALFLGMLGHDLRTPLGAILNSAELMLASGTLSPSNAKAASNIVSSSLHIKQMLSDLLDVTSTRLGGSLFIEPESTDLGSTCQQVIAEVQAAHPTRTVTLTLTGDLTGTWDAGRLSQLLSNLVQNAMQHGAKDTPVALSVTGENGHVVLTVHNEGPPIPQSARQQMFEPLVKSQDLTRGQRTSRGLGLGLYIAQSIVHAHGGSIDVESSQAQGTAFTVRLPKQP
jgi:signal transduction histidine kinase